MRIPQYTPGPWMYEKRPKYGAVHNYCDIRTVEEVAHAPKWSGPTFIGEAYEEADAQLIAAAPDLLEVARRVADHFADTDAPLGAAARAAIAKAAGR